MHAYAGVAWTVDALAGSLVVQSVLSLLWTATAMGLMVFAHRKALRPMWLVGAGLLGAVVLKLLFVDLAGKGTIEQIVSFVGVGLLILLIGYLAPVPPGAVAARSHAMKRLIVAVLTAVAAAAPYAAENAAPRRFRRAVRARQRGRRPQRARTRTRLCIAPPRSAR